MSGRVWLPKSSLADGKRTGMHEVNRKKAKITRRTTSTVEPPSLQTANGGSEKNGRQNYSTIERSSYKNNSVTLEYESASSEVARPCNNQFCGWETNGRTRSALESSSSLKRYAAERGSLSTPADGYRSGLQSRACSRAGGHKTRDCYEFKHFTDTQAHLEDYCTRYSYTALSLPRESAGTIREVATGLDGDGHGREGRGEASYGAQIGLQQLASRLGVGVRDSKQLRYRPQPTPPDPSFTKKNRVAADLLVSTQEDKSIIQEQYYNQAYDHTSVSEESPQEPEFVSRVTSASQDKPHTTAALLELPKLLSRIRAKKSSALSTTSVNKYLTISSRPQHRLPLGLGEEESAVDGSSHGSPGEAEPTVSDTLLEETEMKYSPEARVGVHSSLAKGKSRGRQPTLFDDDSWRDRVLTQKAQALGLISRDWAQTSLLKRVISDHTHTSQPHTRGETTGYRHSPNTSTSKDSSQRDKIDTTVSRPRTSCEKTTSANNTRGKLEKLRSISEPDGHRNKQSPSRRQQLLQEASVKRRCEAKQSKRPATRCSDIESNRKYKESRQRQYSRPGTKLGKKMHFPVKPGLESDESQYWNEVPDQSNTKTGAHLIVDSRPITRGADHRPLQCILRHN